MPFKSLFPFVNVRFSVLVKKKVSFRIFIFVEFVSGFAFVGQYILRLQGWTSMSSFGNLKTGRRESALLFSYHPFYFGFVIFVDFFFLVLRFSVFSVTP